MPTEPTTETMQWARQICVWHRSRSRGQSIPHLHSPEPCDDCEQYASFLTEYGQQQMDRTAEVVDHADELYAELRALRKQIRTELDKRTAQREEIQSRGPWDWRTREQRSIGKLVAVEKTLKALLDPPKTETEPTD